MVRQLLMNPLWIQPPAWLAIDPKAAEEPRESADEFIYHRPVLQKEAVELLKPKTGVLILDGTCGGGGHSTNLGLAPSEGRFLIWVFLPDNSKTRSAASASFEMVH